MPAATRQRATHPQLVEPGASPAAAGEGDPRKVDRRRHGVPDAGPLRKVHTDRSRDEDPLPPEMLSRIDAGGHAPEVEMRLGRARRTARLIGNERLERIPTVVIA